jgi:hypothetical protein
LIFYAYILAFWQSKDRLSKIALTELKRLTNKTKDNPSPTFPLKWDVPAMFWRACINTAVGSARSFFSNLNRCLNWDNHEQSPEVRKARVFLLPMNSKSKMGAGTGLAPPGVSVAHYALNEVAPTGQLLREAIMHGCPKKPRDLSPVECHHGQYGAGVQEKNY